MGQLPKLELMRVAVNNIQQVNAYVTCHVHCLSWHASLHLIFSVFGFYSVLILASNPALCYA